MREAAVEKAICDYAKSKGWLVYKFVSPGHTGVPDRLLISPNGKVVFMEVKAKGKKPTPLQYRELIKLTEQKVAAVWCDSVQLGMVLLDTLG